MTTPTKDLLNVHNLGGIWVRPSGHLGTAFAAKNSD